MTLAVSCALLATFGTPQTIKDIMQGNSVYTTLADTVAQQIATQAKQEQSKQNPQSGAANETPQPSGLQSELQSKLQTAAKESFNPAFLRASSEQVIDGTYHWLDGTAARPDFKVDLTPAVQKFQNKIAGATAERIKKLPVCTLAQLRAINPAVIDINNLTCLPPGLNADAQRQTVINAATSQNEFLKNPILTADRIPKNSNGQTVFERASTAPIVFQWVKVAPWILGGLALLLAAAVTLLSAPYRKGVGSLAVSLIGCGLFLGTLSLVAGWLFNRTFNAANSPLHLTDGGIQQSAVAVIGAFNRIIIHNLLIFGIVYVGIGIVALGVLRLTRLPKPDAVPASPLDERRAAVRS